jgi:thiosulfate/3-mercaptopyruvate sulfurtransferase
MMSPIVSPGELAQLQTGQGKLVVVDCRFSLADPSSGERDYQKAHIPGAVYLHLERDLSGEVEAGVTGRHPLPDAQKLARRLEEVGIASDSTVVVYDADHGAFAARLWWLLRWLGHDDVAVLDGGWANWCAHGFPETQSAPQSLPGNLGPSAKLSIRLRPEMLVDAAEVEEVRVREDARLFDARASDRFRGENETIDPVAGHIPGAHSLPFMNNLHQGKFREPAELRSYFEQALHGVSPGQAVVYCGSGVTACQHLLAFEYAGLSGMRLYPGSWSEWITCESRPIALGD